MSLTDAQFDTITHIMYIIIFLFFICLIPYESIYRIYKKSRNQSQSVFVPPADTEKRMIIESIECVLNTLQPENPETFAKCLFILDVQVFFNFRDGPISGISYSIRGQKKKYTGHELNFTWGKIERILSENRKNKT